MNVYSYIVPIDDGAAPNPYGGVCTLAICKPNLRKIASVNDWVLGCIEDTQSETLQLLYAMKITQVMSMQAYDAFTLENLPIKVPNLKSPCIETQMGDSVYDFSSKEVSLRPSVHSRCTKQMDLDGKNVLLSEHFFYFGKKSIALPQEFELLAHSNEDFIELSSNIYEPFLNWFEQQNFEPNRVYSEPHRVGIVHSSTKSIQKSCCIRKQVERPFYKQ